MACADKIVLSMRVLIITGSFPPMRCGIGDYSHRLAHALALDPAIHVGVLTSEDGGESDGIALFPVIKTWTSCEALKIIGVIRRWSPDIVHIQYPTQGYGNGFLPWIVPIISFLMRKKVVQTWHENYGRRAAPKLLLKAMIPGGLVVVRPGYREGLPASLRWTLWHKRFTFIRNASPFPKITLNDLDSSWLKNQYLNGQKRLIAFFGFVYPNKGAELLFEIADPASDQIVIAGEIVAASDYHRQIMSLASAEPWAGKVTVTGFLAPADIAALLAVADAVILPYRAGGGEWNTSIHAAVLQGSFVITTSLSLHGYDDKHNMFYSRVDDIGEMKTALSKYGGRKRSYEHDVDKDEWRDIASRHVSLYETLLSR